MLGCILTSSHVRLYRGWTNFNHIFIPLHYIPIKCVPQWNSIIHWLNSHDGATTHLNKLVASPFSLVGSTCLFIKPSFFETSPFASKTWEQPWNCPFLLVNSGFSSFFMAETASRGQPWSVFQASAKPLAWWAELGGLLAERHLGGLGRVPWQRSIWLPSGLLWLMMMIND